MNTDHGVAEMRAQKAKLRVTVHILLILQKDSTTRNTARKGATLKDAKVKDIELKDIEQNRQVKARNKLESYAYGLKKKEEKMPNNAINRKGKTTEEDIGTGAML